MLCYNWVLCVYATVLHFLKKLLSIIPLYGYTIFYISVHQLIGGHLVCSFWLLWIMLLWTFMYTFLCGKSNNRQGLIGWGLGKCEWGESSEGKIESCLDLCFTSEVATCHLAIGQLKPGYSRLRYVVCIKLVFKNVKYLKNFLKILITCWNHAILDMSG